jgi:hypothetical protein
MSQDENDFTNYSGENIEKRQEILDSALLEGTWPGWTAPMINSLRGLRIIGKGPAMMPLSDNTIGLPFFTRPQLNLSDDNISRSEKLVSLYGCGQNSMGAYVRGLLDERWAAGNKGIILDNKMPFIVPFTQYLKTSNGFNDLQLSIDTSEPGLRSQVYQRVASKLEYNEVFTMNCNFYNPKPSIIQAIIQYWTDYISEVVSGDRQVSPRAWYLMGNRIDYDCRIYHLIMNKDSLFLEHIFATIQSIPTTYPAGALASIDNTSNSLRGEGQDDFTVQFSSAAQRQDEWGLINAFNEHSYLYNPNLMPNVRNQFYRELSTQEYIANNFGENYPLILPRAVDGNRSGMKLTWWKAI